MVAVAQFFFLRRTNWEGKLSDRTAAAYSDFLSAVAMLATHQPGDLDAMDKANHQLADAKCRIAVYGEPEVLRAIAAFARLGNVFDTEEQRASFVNIVQVMRQSNGAKLQVAGSDILSTLFGISAQDLQST